MAMAHTPLDPGALAPEIQRALASPATKLMAARGIAPVANPGDLITLLYQLALDPDSAVSAAAVRSATDLPPNILRAALGAAIDPRVLDWCAHRVLQVYELIEIVILNHIAADATICWIAERGGAREVDLIATNQQRMLRHPAIIGAMYMNKHARMSTVDRAVELAMHNRIKVPGIPAWEETCAALMASGKRENATAEDDAEFAAAALRGEGELREVTDEELLEEAERQQKRPWSMRTLPEKIRLVTLGNAFVRAFGIRDNNKLVAMATIKAPGVKESEVQKWAGNSALHGDVIGYIADRREWLKQYTTKVALVSNPKCPVKVSTQLVPHLREREMKAIARSKSVPSAVAAQCRKMLMNRGSGGGKGGK